MVNLYYEDLMCMSSSVCLQFANDDIILCNTYECGCRVVGWQVKGGRGAGGADAGGQWCGDVVGQLRR